MLSINKYFRTLVTLLFFTGIYSVEAANKTPVQAPIEIKAQYLLLDEAKGISKYSGNVLFTKGTLVIKADTITLYSDGENLTKAVITGSPADVQHQPENEEKVHSQANKMQYIVATEQLTLTGSAFVNQGDRHFSGEVIKYNTQQRIVTASGRNNPGVSIDSATFKDNPDGQPIIDPPAGRVHVIIGPEDSQKN